jgi:RimJ/RimL family protein N-acetyltransferase
MGMSGAAQHTVRPMEVAEARLAVDYFHDATDEHLARIGVDRALLPSREDWLRAFAVDERRPLAQRAQYGVVWVLDGEVVGFSRTERIELGEQAFMHLHILRPPERRQGHGARFVRLSAHHYFEVLGLRRLYCEPNAYNVAPNRTLQRAGFRYDHTHDSAPTPINHHQALTRWTLERQADLASLLEPPEPPEA